MPYTVRYAFRIPHSIQRQKLEFTNVCHDLNVTILMAFVFGEKLVNTVDLANVYLISNPVYPSMKEAVPHIKGHVFHV